MTDLIVGLIGLLGVLLGALITSIINLRLKTKEARLRILEKIFDKRVIANERILEIVKAMRTVRDTGKKDNDSNIISFPVAMESKETLSEFTDSLLSIVNQNSHWLEIDLVRELYFTQDYLITLSNNISAFESSKYPEIGKIIKLDFLDLSYYIEQKTIQFFEKDILKVNIKRTKKHHKYKRKVTNERLGKTLLYREWSKIENINNSAQQ